jgi:hypothetical protein
LYKFLVYQKTVETSLDLSKYGFKASLKNPDIRVEIIKKTIPDEYKKKIYSIGDKFSFIYKKNIGLFTVEKGRQITIIPETNSETLIAQQLINFPFALCMSQNSLLVLHASAIYFKGKVLLFCGKSHAGKSTTSALFCKNGGKLIAEDISVTEITKVPKIFPSAPYIKLSDEASERFNLTKKIKTIKENDSRNFYNSLNFLGESLSVDYCFFLEWHEETKIMNINESDTLKNLLTYSFVSGSEKDLKKILRFLTSIKFYKLKIKKDLNEIDKVFSLTSKRIGLQV